METNLRSDISYISLFRSSFWQNTLKKTPILLPFRLGTALITLSGTSILTMLVGMLKEKRLNGTK